MNTKYEVIEIDRTEITVDVSLLLKTEDLFFNATQMAKPFGKKVKFFLRLESTKEYIREILKGEDSTLLKSEDLIMKKRGKYGGTWLHKELAFEFAGWCSPVFRRKLHKWVEERLRQKDDWKRKRLETKTGFLPMTNAIMNAHHLPKYYHYRNEADLINRIVLGKPAKAYKAEMGVEKIRDAVTAAELKELNRLQIINTGLIEIGMPYKERKEHLKRCHRQETEFPG